MKDLIFALWFFLPAGVANAAPVFANKIPGINRWKTPVDLGQKYRGTRLSGDNKTWRGLASGVAVSLAVISLQRYLYLNFDWARDVSYNVNYVDPNIWLLGALLGFGALIGDLVESFLKRRAGVKPGDSWFPYDQIDFVVGGLLASLLVVTLGVWHYVLILAVWFLMHVIFSYLGFLVGLKKKPI